MFTTNSEQTINNLDNKMFAVCLKTTNEVVSMWIGKEDKDADYDRSKYFMVELNEQNSPAHCPGRYNGKTFDKEY